jgi:hypothetical protein
MFECCKFLVVICFVIGNVNHNGNNVLFVVILFEAIILIACVNNNDIGNLDVICQNN